MKKPFLLTLEDNDWDRVRQIIETVEGVDNPHDALLWALHHVRLAKKITAPREDNPSGPGGNSLEGGEFTLKPTYRLGFSKANVIKSPLKDTFVVRLADLTKSESTIIVDSSSLEDLSSMSSARRQQLTLKQLIEG